MLLLIDENSHFMPEEFMGWFIYNCIIIPNFWFYLAPSVMQMPSMDSIRRLNRRDSTLYVNWYSIQCLSALSIYLILFMYLSNHPLIHPSIHRQLQPLVARMQCGDMQFVLCGLLADRQEERGISHRSTYRQLLFLKCLLNPNTFDIGMIITTLYIHLSMCHIFFIHKIDCLEERTF